MSTLHVSGEVIEAELHGVANVLVLDADYLLVEEEFFHGEVMDAWKRDQQAHGLTRYDGEAWDCDDFAFDLFQFVRRAHRVTQIKTSNIHAAVAVGVMCYCVDGDNQKGHAVNFVMTPGGVRCFEPQRYEWFVMSAVELRSRFFAIV